MCMPSLRGRLWPDACQRRGRSRWNKGYVRSGGRQWGLQRYVRMWLLRCKGFDDRLDGCSGLRGGSVSWWGRVSGMGVNGDMVRNDVYLDFRRLVDGRRWGKALWRRCYCLNDRSRHRLSDRRRWRDRRCGRGLKGDRDGCMKASSANVSHRSSERAQRRGASAIALPRDKGSKRSC